MHPFEVKQIVYQTQIAVSVVDPVGVGEPDNDGVVDHEYDEIGARAAGVLMRGGSARRAVALMQKTFRADWGTAMSLATRWRLIWRLQKDVVRPFVKPALNNPMP